MFLYYMLTLYSCVTIVVPQQVLVKNNLQEHESIVHFQETEQPQNNRNVQSESKIVSKQRTETPAQDSYLPLQSVNFEDQSLTPSGNNISQPSIELQPPSLGENGNVNYYSSSRSRQISTDLNRSGEESVVLSQQMVQITNSSQALINFGLNLLKNIDGKGKNVVLSPYSVATLLALLQQGALGSTQQQITQALQMTPQLSRDNFRKFSEEFQKRNSRNVLRVANNMFIADAFNLNPMFKRVAMRNFASEVTPIRFSQSEQAVRKINNWVATKTNDKIQEIVTTDSVGENTQIVLVNAVYFKGIWQVRFKPESTMPRPFHLNAGAGEVTKTVPFMRMRRIFKTGVDSVNKAQVIIIPFESEQYSIVVVLPSETTSLDTIVSTLTDSQLADYNKFSPKEVDLEIPKFTVRSDIALNQVLGKMGITNIFGDKAELMGVGNFRTFSPQVSSALHSAMLSIDEDGGTAGAATAFAVVALSYIDPSVVFRANRPFLAVLWDSQEGLPLFMARKRNSRNVLRVANNMFIADAFNLNPMFKRVAMRNFASEVTPIRFSQSEQAVRKINNWVATKTNDKIQEIVTTDSVGENTQIVLVNAVYFKGIWQVRFKPESTMPRPFHLNAGAGEVTKTVPFMRMRRIFKTGVDSVNKAQVIIIPFESEQYSIVVVLPSETTSLDTIVSTLTDSQLADYNKFSPKEVDLEIPKFTVRSDIALNQVLGKMGITNIFGDKAELMGVGNFRTFSPQVSSALHSAMLSIDEDGGTAGAATAFAVVALSYIDPSVVFRANRPFLAVLWDSQEGLPLFMARVEDPTV